jgi:mitochondrial chaperone BCS1
LFSGRIDVRILFENATQAQAAELFRKFYPRIPELDVAMMSKEFSSCIPDRKFSMAHLQGYLMGQKNDPVAAVTGITEWVQRHENADEQTIAFHDQPVEDFGNTEMSGASTPSRPSTPNRIPLSWQK